MQRPHLRGLILKKKWKAAFDNSAASYMILLRERCFHVDRGVLAVASPIFKQCFSSGDFTQNTTENYKFSVNVTPEIIEQFLLFYYHYFAPEISNYAKKLIEVAHFYQVQPWWTNARSSSLWSHKVQNRWAAERVWKNSCEIRSSVSHASDRWRTLWGMEQELDSVVAIYWINIKFPGRFSWSNDGKLIRYSLFSWFPKILKLFSHWNSIWSVKNIFKNLRQP